jgi:hypothetical protein
MSSKITRLPRYWEIIPSIFINELRRQWSELRGGLGGRSLGYELLSMYFRISSYSLPSVATEEPINYFIKRGLRILHKVIIVNTLASSRSPRKAPFNPCSTVSCV